MCNVDTVPACFSKPPPAFHESLIAGKALSVYILFVSLQVYHSGCPWESAQTHLNNMALYKVREGTYQSIVNIKSR